MRRHLDISFGRVTQVPHLNVQRHSK